MITTARVLPSSERIEPEHAFILAPGGPSPLFAGWGPRL
jgi:hypothetical protein